MSDDTKECIIISIAIIAAIFIIVGGLVYNASHKRNKIQECINQTNNELECGCVYWQCGEGVLEEIK